MDSITRRSFLKTSATALGAAVVASFPRTLVDLAHAETQDYFEREFGVTDALCRKVLSQAMSKGGDYADLYFEHSVANYVILEDGKVNRAYCDVGLGVGIRTVKGDQVGYGFTQELSQKSMMAAAATAATIAAGPAGSPAGRFTALKTENYYPLKTLLTSVPLESKLPVVQAVNDKCFSLSPLVVKVNAQFHDEQKRVLVVTSDGVKAEDLRPRNYLYAGVVAEKDGKRERTSWNLGGRKDFSYYTTEVVNEIANQAVTRALVLFDAVQP
ncbi:MAG: twin-arginine translocation signal domain-containing protein, partial [Candidatus Eisenbacteria bacterium]|nr:twin-arginine translocation signal domain-containing protein [Candidatus Eisenbacteria bacterium]